MVTYVFRASWRVFADVNAIMTRYRQGAIRADKLREAGVDLVAIAATSGDSPNGVFPDYAANLAAVRQAGLLVAHCHVSALSNDVEGQGQQFVDAVDLRPGEAVVLDVEHDGGDVPGYLGYVGEGVLTFCRIIGQELARVPILRIRDSVVTNQLGEASAALADLPLWLVSAQPEEAFVPEVWRRAAVSEWTRKEQIEGQDAPISISTFHGGREAVLALGGISEWTVEADPVDPRLELWTVSVTPDQYGNARTTIPVPAELVVAVTAMGTPRGFQPDENQLTTVVMEGLVPLGHVLVQAWAWRGSNDMTPNRIPPREVVPRPEGGSVHELQRLLSEVLYPIAVDGQYGPQTRLAVRRFQEGYAYRDLAIDGDAGDNTWNALRHSHSVGGKASDHFKFAEWRCKCRERGLGNRPGFCNGQVWVTREAIRAAECLRVIQGPLRVVSGCRCDKYNGYIGGATLSQHRFGKACDTSPRISYNDVRARCPTIGGIGTKKGLALHIDVGPKRTWAY